MRYRRLLLHEHVHPLHDATGAEPGRLLDASIPRIPRWLAPSSR